MKDKIQKAATADKRLRYRPFQGTEPVARESDYPSNMISLNAPWVGTWRTTWVFLLYGGLAWKLEYCQLNGIHILLAIPINVLYE